MKLRVLLSATALTSASFIIPTAAWAAEPAPQATAAAATLQAAPVTKSDEEASDENIVVTGSRIRRPNVESDAPITSITGQELFNQGQTNLGDTLSDLPQLRSTFVQQNPGAGVGIAGLNLLDLRGLGTSRTLVLVNGRRHVASDILSNASSVDVNTIANDIIERVEVVTGGKSAVYGSDAIGGVVNFILKRDFNGFQVRGNAAVSEAGFGANQFISGIAGKNFGDGRGNITAQIEYANQARVYASDIPAFTRADGFATVDADSPGLALGSDGFPDAVFVRDIRSSTTHRFGLVPIIQPSTGGLCGTGTLANNGPANTSGTAFHCNYFFTPEGRLVQQTGTRFGTGPGGTFVGGNGQTGREGNLLSILPSNQRINANLLARYEFSPALEAFLEAKYSRTDSVGNQLGPTFINNGPLAGSVDSRLSPRLDNPFLNAADRTLISNAILASGCGSTVGNAIAALTCTPLTATQRTNIANGSYRFAFARTLTDSPDRDEVFRRTTYRVVAGLRGQFNDDWKYEVSANYGRFEESVDFQGFVDRQRFLLSLDAGLNPLTNQIQCRAQFDTASATGLAGNTAAAAKLASDIAACVPYNPFGQPNNAAATSYFRIPLANSAYLSQLDIQGFVSGDSSQLFSLPGGPVSFVLGGEYRREKAFNNSDAAADNLLSNAVFLGDVNAPPLTVTEGFGELVVPIVKDVFLLKELTLSGAGRISKYNTGAGTTYTYNAGAQYSPFDGLRLRFSYGRAVRAPNVSESSFPSVPNFANGFIDPCNVNAIGGNPIRGVNCVAQLSTAQLANLPPAGYSIGIISGSNPNLVAETSDSFTYGGVFTPRFLPGFSLSVDYYDIKVSGVIVSLTAQTIVNTCYDSPSLSSPLCSTFQRNLTGSAGASGELPGQILFNSIVSGPQNFASRVRRGLDVEAGYRTNLSANAKLNARLIYTHSFTNSNFQDPTRPNFENYIIREVGDPQDEGRLDLDLTVDRVTFGYQMRVLGSQLVGAYENTFPNNAGVTGATGLPLNADAFDIEEYPATFYHNIRLNFEIGDGKAGRDSFNLFVGADNVLNQLPPLGTTGTGAGTGIFNIRGRNLYAGFRARF
ncbi:TonB-dependent receptor domain-containing protein [Sphingomonas sp. HMP6]|uniref:TonB-dependent receptor domain-containing protein n=1 Tax=Sphingomonas sp. HMP6 TaxID=1517551 RepID=UPI001596CD40|nr:TonB-dependent receptor [Sphingomonas sp. HMP6]